MGRIAYLECPQVDDKRRPPPEGVRKLGSGPSFSQATSRITAAVRVSTPSLA